MFFLARSNLFAEKTRLAISIGGVAFAVLLILVLGGLYRGWQTKLTLYLESLDANLWVGQQGSADTTHSMSFLPATLAADLASVPGVSRVDEFVGRQISVTSGGKDYRLFLVGYDPAAGRNGPLAMVRGTAAIERGQIVIDEAFARKAHLTLGDTMTVSGQRLTIAGISAKGNSLIYQYAFVTQADARDILQLGPQINYFLIKADDPATVRARLTQRFAALNVMTKAEFLANNRALVTETFLPIVGVLVLIAFLVGSAIVGLTIYTATIEKAREYGVLKALGATNGVLYRVVLEQSFIAGVLGFVFGLGLSFAVNALANRLVAGFITAVGWADAAGVFGVAMLMSLLAAWIPVRRLASIDPAIVFKS